MRIHITELKLNEIFGVYPAERKAEQPVVVDCQIDYDFSSGAYIDYERVAKIIVKTLKQKKFRLVEEALLFLSSSLKSQFSQINSINLKIVKPQIMGNCQVGVEYSKSFL